MNYFYILLCAILSLSCSSHSNPSASTNNTTYLPNPTGSLLCEKTIRAYPKLRDHGPINEYGALFSQDAHFEVKKLSIFLQGRDQITERLKSALATTKTIHMVEQIEINQISNNKYQARSSFTLQLKKRSEPNASVVLIKGHYDDILQLDGKQCVITSRQVNIDSQSS
jgi:hypothetical protein